MGRRSFDARRAIWLAAACAQTYKQYESPNGEFVVPDGFKVVTAFEAHSLNRVWEPFGFILQSRDEVVVAFRGTSSTSDWLSDALAFQTEYPYARNAGMTHSGFTQIYQSARDQIVAALKDIPPGKQLYVTGHSLGGALAILCAMDLAVHTPFRPILYTFGSPRVGNPAFVRSFMERVRISHRVSNLYDAVTYLPPSTLKLPRTGQTYDYRHIRTLYSLEFQNGSLSSNHVIGSYFARLAKLDPEFAKRTCKANPGFCPAPFASYGP